MLAEYMTETEQKIKQLNLEDRQILLNNIHNWFDTSEPIDVSSSKTLNDYMWSHDPIISDGGVVDFAISNNLILKKG